MPPSTHKVRQSGSEGSSKNVRAYPRWLEDAAIYQIFPPSFQDSNDDGIGDLNGIRQRLDHIASLGCDTIWLSPIYESPFEDAGYDVTDHLKIAPRYGTMEDFDALLEAVHGRGMRLLLDFIPGHTSNRHPWFKESLKSKQNPFADRYVWTDTTFYGPGRFEVGGNFVSGAGQRDGNYLANFFYFQPALNYGYADPDPAHPWQLPTSHPSVKRLRDEMQAIMRFWLDRGVDGFRIDMAGSMVKGRDPEKIQAAMVEFWNEVRGWWDRHYPHAALIAEWSNPSHAVETGLHMDFMIHFEEATYMQLCRGENERTIIDKDDVSYFDGSGKGRLAPFWEELNRHLEAIRDKGVLSLPTGNHDLPRYSLGRSEAEIKCILTLLLCLPTVPTIYYGDEIGLGPVEGVENKEGGYRRTGARAPMKWTDAEGSGFSEASSEDFYLPVASKGRSVDAQERDPDSPLHHLRKLLRLRKEHPALGLGGDLKAASDLNAPYPFAFERSGPDGSLLVAINPLDRPARLPACRKKGPAELLTGAASIHRDGDSLDIELPAYGSAILG